MPPTEPADGAAPEWLQRADAELADHLERVARWQADQINAHLAALGITPIRPAGVRPGQLPTPLSEADLVRPDPEQGLFGLSASHDGTQVFLEIEDHGGIGDCWPGPALFTLADIAWARREGTDPLPALPPGAEPEGSHAR
jgi:hypothetical protein